MKSNCWILTTDRRWHEVITIIPCNKVKVVKIAAGIPIDESITLAIFQNSLRFNVLM